MSFSEPLLLLTLVLPLLAVAVFVRLVRRPTRHPVAFTNLDVLATVAARRRSPRTLVPAALLLAAAAVACAAVARPEATRLVADERATVILVLDASRSMESTDIRPSRLVAAERAALAFLGRVPDRLRVALIVFSGDVQVATPPTTDHRLVRESIAGVGNFSGFGGTAIGDAIARAVELGQDAVAGPERALAAARPRRDRARGLVSIVFLSDGRQNRGILPPLEGAARARAAGIPVYTVALGTRRGGTGAGGGFAGPFGRYNRAPDPATLRAIARATGGEFYEARSAAAARQAYAELGSKLGRKPGRTEITFAFAAAAAFLVAGAAVLSTLWSPRLP